MKDFPWQGLVFGLLLCLILAAAVDLPSSVSAASKGRHYDGEVLLVRNVIGENGDLGQGDLVAVLQGHGLTKKRALELLDEVPSRVGKRGKREYFL